MRNIIPVVAGIVLSVTFSISCYKQECIIEAPVQDPSGTGDTSTVSVTFIIDGGQKCNLFIYESTGVRKLLCHSVSPVTCIELRKGEYLAVALADGPWEFNEKALETFDAIESLLLPFCQEDPALPLRSCMEVVDLSSDTVILHPMALMAEIELSCVDKRFSKELSSVRIENLSIHLENASAWAEPARTMGFRPTEFLNEGQLDTTSISAMTHPECLWQELGMDAGIFALYPKRKLHCYPNDPPQEDIGCPRTRFVLEGDICNEHCRWAVDLPPIHRAARLSLEFVIFSKEKFSCFVYE